MSRRSRERRAMKNAKDIEVATGTAAAGGGSFVDVVSTSKNVEASTTVASKIGKAATKRNDRRGRASNLATNGKAVRIGGGTVVEENLVLHDEQAMETTPSIPYSPSQATATVPAKAAGGNAIDNQMLVVESCSEDGAHLVCDSGAAAAAAALVVCHNGSATTRMMPDNGVVATTVPKQSIGGRALRPRQATTTLFKATPKRSGPFQEVVLCDADVKRIVGRRIKVFWPLDSKWYYGEVKAYNSARKLHKIVYDDKDEEWLKLQKEQFKLQVLEGEVFGAQLSVVATHSSDRSADTQKAARVSARRFKASSERGENGVPATPLTDAVLVSSDGLADHPDLELSSRARNLSKLLGQEDVVPAAGPDAPQSTEKVAALDHLATVEERMLLGDSLIVGNGSLDHRHTSLLSDSKPGTLTEDQDDSSSPDQQTSGDVLSEIKQSSGVLEEKPGERLEKDEVPPMTENECADHCTPDAEQMELMATHMVPGFKLHEVNESANSLPLSVDASVVCPPSLSDMMDGTRIAQEGSVLKDMGNVLVAASLPLDPHLSLCVADGVVENGLSINTEPISETSLPKLITIGQSEDCSAFALMTSTWESKEHDMVRTRDKELLGEVMPRQCRKRKRSHPARLVADRPGIVSACETWQPQILVREDRHFTKYIGTYLVHVACLISLQHYESLEVSSTDIWRTILPLKLSIFPVSFIDGFGRRVKQAVLTDSQKEHWLVPGVLANDRDLLSADEIEAKGEVSVTLDKLSATKLVELPDISAVQTGGGLADDISQEQAAHMDPCNRTNANEKCVIEYDQAQFIHSAHVDDGQAVCPDVQMEITQTPSELQLGSPSELDSKKSEQQESVYKSGLESFEAVVVKSHEGCSLSEKQRRTTDTDETLGDPADHSTTGLHISSNTPDVDIALGGKKHIESKEACAYAVVKSRFSCGSRITESGSAFARSRKRAKHIPKHNMECCATVAEEKIHEMPSSDPGGMLPAKQQKVQAESNTRDNGGSVGLSECEVDGGMSGNGEPKQVGSELPRVNVLKLWRCPTNKTQWRVATSPCVLERGSNLSHDSAEPLTPAPTADRKRPFVHCPESLQSESPEENGQSIVYPEDLGNFDNETSVSPTVQSLNLKGKEIWSNCDASSIQGGICISKKRPRIGSISPVSSDDAGGSFSRADELYQHRHPMDQSDLQGAEFANSGCNANVLIVEIDKGWREIGASVELQLCEGQGWMLVVSIGRESVYTHKAEQSIPSGTTNRYTHAMMWKGGKGWSLEFEDRKQWQVFKEMHEECFQRNARAASVRHIPIPGVTHVEDFSTKGPECQFTRPSAKYIGQVENEVELALANTQVVYDMDSEDEQWLVQVNKQKDSADCTTTEPFVAEETLERLMDKLEKGAFVKQQDSVELVSAEFAGELCQGLASEEVINLVYAYWSGKRDRKGMALVRHFQPAPWEIYQKQMQMWQDQFMQLQQQSLTASKQQLLQQCRRPPLFAFCLRPRGLEARRILQKQRSHRKQSVNGNATRNWISVGSMDGALDSPSKRDYCAEPVNGLYLGLTSHGGPRPTEEALRATLADPFNGYAGEADVPGWSMPMSELGNAVISEIPQKKFCKSKKASRKVRRLRRLAAAQESRRRAQLPSNISTGKVPDVAVAAAIARSGAEAARARAQALYAVADAAMHRAVVAVIAAGAFQTADQEPVKEERMANGGASGLSFGSWRRAVPNSVSKCLNPQGLSGQQALASEVDDALLPVASWSQELGAGLGSHLLDKDALSVGTAQTGHGEGLVTTGGLGLMRNESMMAMLTM
ncbi:hypothetical protein BDL97_06G081100 [Sphagnum fallax]|nr:hypothetical protein BDL97_06G081100 [Sphagnum fallax]